MQAEAPQTPAGEPAPGPNRYARSYRLQGYTVFELRGEIDLAALPETEPQLDALTSLPRPRLVIDLRRTEFFDCSGLRLLCRAYRRVDERAGTLRVVCDRQLTLRILRAAQLTTVFRPVGTLEEALTD
ncbi:hypothetical protein SRB5_15080 [Streptomyces sp. RB5]|uniref:Anti-sigma factor antagonist n=1 Tax=Streptomyces smaragdinus TaxID=2585196 RepID=A0A7K0CEB2_9ACTN|nr:STAS domain-containing protein [Streptomyces smaragdinus]MQY11392.1 hypothetical protein [Streptomyces smaragdinus]